MASSKIIFSEIYSQANPKDFGASGGHVNEHGRIPQVGELWRRILNNVQTNPALTGIYSPLTTRISEEMNKVNYPFAI